MLNAIAKPFGWLMMSLYELVGNYGAAIILFALVVKLILLPFQMKSKRSTLRTSGLQAQMKELEKKHGANKQKYNEEVQKLYKEEGVNPMSGCLWSLLPFPILIALYQAIRYPLTIMMGVPAALLEEGGLIMTKLTELGFTTKMNSAYIQISQSQFIANNWSEFEPLSDKLRQIDYTFLGLDLGAQPSLSALKNIDWSNSASIAALALILIPILAGLLTFLQSKISSASTPGGDESAAKSMNTMLIIMPFVTVYFAFVMPASMGIYWIASSLFAIIQDLFLNKHFSKVMAVENAERNARRSQRERELEEKRIETERLKAENATKRNANTSKKKLHLTSREGQREKATQWQKDHEQKDTDNEPGRVGDRKYARGRAYAADRYQAGFVEEERDFDDDDETITLPVYEDTDLIDASADQDFDAIETDPEEERDEFYESEEEGTDSDD